MFHFVITWEIYLDGEEEGTIHQRLMNILEGFDIVPVLSNTVVVRLEEQEVYADLHKKWADIAAEHKGDVEFIMSPLMKAGQYAGYFHEQKWEKLTAALEQEEGHSQ